MYCETNDELNSLSDSMTSIDSITSTDSMPVAAHYLGSALGQVGGSPKYFLQHKFLKKEKGLKRELLERMLDEILETKKINIDTVRETFNYLSLEELSQMATRDGFLMELIGNYVREAHPKLLFYLRPTDYAWPLKGYAKHVRIEQSDDFGEVAKAFPSNLKTLRFDYIPNAIDNEYRKIEDKLENVEELVIEDGCPNEGFHYSVLKYCLNLKRLSIKCPREKNQLLARQIIDHDFPHLEHLYISGITINEEFKDFIRKHKHLNSLTLDHMTLQPGSGWTLKKVNGQHFDHLTYELIEFLNGPLDMGIIENIHLKVNYYLLESYPQYFTNLRKITSIEIDDSYHAERDSGKLMLKLPDLKKIKMNSLNSFKFDNYLDGLENKLKILDVETIWGRYLTKKIISTFGQLEEFYLRSTRDRSLFTKRKFEKLEKKRSNLPDACKLTIYVEEDVYLNCKWEDDIDSELIVLKPIYPQYDDPTEKPRHIEDYEDEDDDPDSMFSTQYLKIQTQNFMNNSWNVSGIVLCVYLLIVAYLIFGFMLPLVLKSRR